MIFIVVITSYSIHYTKLYDAVYGGSDAASWDVQSRGLKRGADVVIATPGRLISHINLYDIDFSGVKYFILDEADRMLDMGFFDDIMLVVKRLPKERQTIIRITSYNVCYTKLLRTFRRWYFIIQFMYFI